MCGSGGSGGGDDTFNSFLQIWIKLLLIFHLHWSIFRIDLLEWFTKESHLFNCNKSFFALFLALCVCVQLSNPLALSWAFPFNSSKRGESVHSKLPFSTIEIFNVQSIKWMKLMDWKEVFFKLIHRWHFTHGTYMHTYTNTMYGFMIRKVHLKLHILVVKR